MINLIEELRIIDTIRTMKDIKYKLSFKSKFAKLKYNEKIAFRNLIHDISISDGSYYRNTEKVSHEGRSVNRTKLSNNKYIYWISYSNSIEVLNII